MEVFFTNSTSLHIFDDIAENVTLDDSSDSWLENEDISSLLLLEQPCSDGSIINEEEFNSLCEPLFQSSEKEECLDGNDVLLENNAKIEAPSVETEFQRDVLSNQFKCPKCQKQFAYLSRLKRHLTTHQVYYIKLSIFVKVKVSKLSKGRVQLPYLNFELIH